MVTLHCFIKGLFQINIKLRQEKGRLRAGSKRLSLFISNISEQFNSDTIGILFANSPLNITETIHWTIKSDRFCPAISKRKLNGYLFVFQPTGRCGWFRLFRCRFLFRHLFVPLHQHSVIPRPACHSERSEESPKIINHH